MVIHKKVIADGELVHARRRAQQIKDNNHENKSQTHYKYKAGARKRKGKLIRFGHPGLYEITSAHNNGTVMI